VIHKTAIVNTKQLGSNVVVKEYAIVRDDVVLGDNVIIHPHVVIESGVRLGDNVEVFPGAYIGKEPKGAGATARTPIFNKKIVIGNNTSIGPNAVIYCDVTIGNNTLIGDGASIREQCSIGNYCIISRCVTVNYNATIGNKTKVMDLTHITGNCIIGDDVFISVGVNMANDNNVGPSATYSKDKIKGPEIKDDVVIGIGAILLPKILIGERAFVAAGAVVTKDVEPSTLVAGIPAKFVRNLDN